MSKTTTGQKTDEKVHVEVTKGKGRVGVGLSVGYGCPTNPTDCTATVGAYAVASVPGLSGGNIEADIELSLTITVTPIPSEVVTVVVTPGANTSGGGTVRVGPGTGHASQASVAFRILGNAGSSGSLTIAPSTASASGSYAMSISTNP